MRYTSVSSYVMAVQFRSKRTVLVEGRDDAWVVFTVAAALRNRELCRSEFVLDSADMINSSGAGARAKVEDVARECVERAAAVRPVCLVDREYSGVDFSDVDGCVAGCVEAIAANGEVRTRGHSVENYLLEERWMVRYVSTFFGETFSLASGQEWENGIASAWLPVMAFAAAASEGGALKRSRGLDWLRIWKDGDVSDKPASFDQSAVMKQLADRGLSSADIAGIVGRTSVLIEKFANAGAACRWLADGHIAWEGIWGALGATARRFGAEQDRYRKIATGFREEKIRFLAAEWAHDFGIKPQNEWPIAARLVCEVDEVREAEGESCPGSEAAVWHPNLGGESP